MVKNPGYISRLAGLVIAAASLMACGGGGASDAEFVAACKNEGQSAASQRLDQELGVSRDAFCTCGASVAKSSLSSDGYRAMVLEMQGKGEEARNITSKMSESEQQASLEVLGTMLEKCGGAEK